jgi:hypothetical protein
MLLLLVLNFLPDSKLSISNLETSCKPGLYPSNSLKNRQLKNLISVVELLCLDAVPDREVKKGDSRFSSCFHITKFDTGKQYRYYMYIFIYKKCAFDHQS